MSMFVSILIGFMLMALVIPLFYLCHALRVRQTLKKLDTESLERQFDGNIHEARHIGTHRPGADRPPESK